MTGVMRSPTVILLPLLLAAALLLMLFATATRPQIEYRPHAVERHGADAEEARRIGEDPDSQCTYFSCSSSINPLSLLRICYSPWHPGRWAIQWLIPTEAGMVEGTSFLKSSFVKVLKYLDRNGCTPVRYLDQ